MTKATLEVSDWLGVYWWVILLIFLIPVIIIWRWWSTPKGRIWRDQHIVKLPLIGNLLHKQSIEIYFRFLALFIVVQVII